ncbi:hypothetical protein FGO68_gene7810 [Halteria grandinella]|uniref:Uncharacterized protein n=1 Tax=Halteria grandinella TaxID=5974 RepID=A0A8J8N9Z2_HALGN|nr:hypothetical protein FGO68_gene7810 [Halteria grandinella]
MQQIGDNISKVSVAIKVQKCLSIIIGDLPLVLDCLPRHCEAQEFEHSIIVENNKSDKIRAELKALK